MVMPLEPAAPERRILLVGHGQMGASLATAWRRAWPQAQVFVVSKPEQQTGARWLDYAQAARQAAFDAIVLAVKPVEVSAVLAELRQFDGAPLLISVAAGVSLDQLRTGCPPGWRCVRAMTSLAISVGAGAAVAASGPLSAEDRALCELLLPVQGGAVWIEEDAMDAATALMGSGPAYFLRLAETLAQAGERLGFSPELAARLAQATLIGAGALAAEAGARLETLKSAVTSPGGATAAALAVLDEGDALAQLISRATVAATRRGAELRRAGRESQGQ
jgi:pyrroline-5-carboxylate reductase